MVGSHFHFTSLRPLRTTHLCIERRRPVEPSLEPSLENRLRKESSSSPLWISFHMGIVTQCVVGEVSLLLENGE